LVYDDVSQFPARPLQHCKLGCTIVLIALDVVIFSMVVWDGWARAVESLASFARHREGFMADRARNQHGLGKAVTFNVITPMTRLGTWIVGAALWIFDRFKSTQKTAKGLAFLPFVHWVIVKRDCFPRPEGDNPAEKLNYDYLFFLSTFNGPWGPYIEAFADVLYVPLDTVWFWSIGYPFSRPVGPLKAYIKRNQVESDHSYSAYPGASVRDVRSGLALRSEVDKFAKNAWELPPDKFAVEFSRLFVSMQNRLGTFHPIP